MQPKISTILREAAANHLWLGTVSEWADRTFYEYDYKKSYFCCDAINYAIRAYENINYNETDDRISAFLREMGQGNGFSEFKEFNYDELIRQEVRYAWLMFAADIAEEEGN